MMLAWSFAARTIEEVAALVRALGRHRYIRETSHALHWLVVESLREDARFAERAAALEARRLGGLDLDLASRDPRLWLPADVEDVLAALAAFWTPGPGAEAARRRLSELHEKLDVARPVHEPFGANPEDPPHPELVLLEWELSAVRDLCPERHAGAVRAMELAGEEVDISAPVYQEAVAIAWPELAAGARGGVLAEDFLVWSDGPYSYADYVFRGAAKAAKLVEAPVGIRDLDVEPREGS
jgi:hypothetical protein